MRPMIFCPLIDRVAPNPGKLAFLMLAAGLTVAFLESGSRPAIAQTGSAQTSSANPAVSSARPSGQTILFVNPAMGQDGTGSGTQRSPFRTIHHALQVAQPNTVILLAPGLYSAESGEVFPLQMRSGITIQGDPSTTGQGTVIRGGGAYQSPTQGGQNVALVGATNAVLRGVTVSNPQGHGVWVESGNPTIALNTFSGSQAAGITITGNALASIQQNRFSRNRTTGIAIGGTAQPEVRQNRFEQTEVGITIAQSAAPLVVQNQISRNRTGVLVQDSARPVLRRNAILQSSDTGVMAIGKAQPDLGRADDPGQNQFRENRRQDVNASGTDQTVPIAGNQFAEQRVSGRVDANGVADGDVNRDVNRDVNLTVVQTVSPQTVSPQTIPRLSASQLSASQGSVHQRSNPVGRSAQPSPTVGQSQPLIGQLPPSPNSLRRSNPVPRPAGMPSRQANRTVQVAQRSGQVSPAAIAPAPSVSIPIPVPPPENPGVLVSSLRPVGIPIANAAPSSVLPSPDPVLMATVPVTVPFPAPQPFAQMTQINQGEAVSIGGSVGGTVGGTANRFAAIPIIPSSGVLPAPPPVPPIAVSTPSLTTEIPGSLVQLASAQSVSVPSSVVQPALTQPVQVARQSNLLPVPDGDAPIGNAGDMPRMNVPAGGSWNAVGGGYGQEQLRATLRYRVVVEAQSERVQALVRSLIPSAFLVSGRGRPLMQIGAFSDRENAEDAVRLLNQNGLRGIIQRL